MGRVFEVSHAIAFAHMRRAICQQQLSVLFLNPVYIGEKDGMSQARAVQQLVGS